MRAKFQQKNFILWQLELVKVFNFSDKLPGFSEITKLRLNLVIEFCVT